MHSISWWDAVKWSNARSEMEGLNPVYLQEDETVFRKGTGLPAPDWQANGHRLPTEAEWEKAVRGGTAGQRYPGGNTATHAQANDYSSASDPFDLSATRGFHPRVDSGVMPFTSPVGSFPANGFGLNDLAGNLREWCWDFWSASAYSDESQDPAGPASGTRRILRGGSWNDPASAMRSAARDSLNPAVQLNTVGFRTVRRPTPGP